MRSLTARWSAFGRTGRATSTRCSSGATGRTYYAFDLLALDSRDIRAEPLRAHKRALRRLGPARTRPPPVSRPRGRTRARSLPGGLRARHGGHRREVGRRPVPHRWHEDLVGQDQESRLQPGRRPARVLRGATRVSPAMEARGVPHGLRSRSGLVVPGDRNSNRATPRCSRM
jgi:hypothetical protein